MFKQKLYEDLIVNNAPLITILDILSKDLSPNLWPRLIGGCVRDSLLGIMPSDIDIATPLHPNRVMSLLPQAKLIPIGMSFGTVKVILNNAEFEITTLRKDVKCDGRHALVEFTDDFKVDAERRDFTINALSYCPLKNELFDYFEGIKHIKERKVLFIGDAEARIKEDYLRIMRFFRFSAKYADALDPSGYTQCTKYADNLLDISAERIKSEFDKILLQEKTKYVLNMMLSGNIIQAIFPSLAFDVDMQEQSAYICSQLKLKPTLSLKYASLLHKNNVAQLSKVLKKQKFSNRSVSSITKLLEKIGDFTSIELLKEKLLLRKYKNIGFEEYAILAGCIHTIPLCIIQECIDETAACAIKTLPISGNDLMSLGYNGKQVGEVLERLENIWIKSKFGLSKERLLKETLAYH